MDDKSSIFRYVCLTTISFDVVSASYSKSCVFYESKFILDLFIFRVSPVRFLRRLAAIINIFPRSRATLVTYLASTRWDFKNGWSPTSTFFHSHSGRWERHPNALLAIHPIPYQIPQHFIKISIYVFNNVMSLWNKKRKKSLHFQSKNDV